MQGPIEVGELRSIISHRKLTVDMGAQTNLSECVLVKVVDGRVRCMSWTLASTHVRNLVRTCNKIKYAIRTLVLWWDFSIYRLCNALWDPIIGSRPCELFSIYFVLKTVTYKPRVDLLYMYVCKITMSHVTKIKILLSVIYLARQISILFTIIFMAGRVKTW